jgi:MFS family permease
MGGSVRTVPAGPAATGRTGPVFALLVLIQFMVVLDAGIVNIALPAIQRELALSPAGLAWVVDAYLLTFGGFLLVGGRAADLLGRRRLFLGGLALFTLASLACGLSTVGSQLILARSAQGLGAALVSPAALALVTDLYAEGPRRNRALGVWGSMGGGRTPVRRWLRRDGLRARRRTHTRRRCDAPPDCPHQTIGER